MKTCEFEIAMLLELIFQFNVRLKMVLPYGQKNRKELSERIFQRAAKECREVVGNPQAMSGKRTNPQ